MVSSPWGNNARRRFGRSPGAKADLERAKKRVRLATTTNLFPTISDEVSPNGSTLRQESLRRRNLGDTSGIPAIPRNRLSFFADPAESPAARDGTSCRIRRRTQQEGELNNDARTQTGPTDPKNRQECHVANGRKTEHLRKTKAEEMPQKPESAGGRKSPGVQNENA